MRFYCNGFVVGAKGVPGRSLAKTEVLTFVPEHRRAFFLVRAPLAVGHADFFAVIDEWRSGQSQQQPRRQLKPRLIAAQGAQRGAGANLIMVGNERAALRACRIKLFVLF